MPGNPHPTSLFIGFVLDLGNQAGFVGILENVHEHKVVHRDIRAEPLSIGTFEQPWLSIKRYSRSPATSYLLNYSELAAQISPEETYGKKNI
jgi:hypothetical protein